MTSDLGLGQVDLDKINSLTKYPSIETYHALDKRNGGLLEECVTTSKLVELTEKVDGTNARLIVLPSGEWLIGSREDLLTAAGDHVPNPALNIVRTLRPVVDRVAKLVAREDRLTTLYFEVFGASVGPNAKQYTTTNSNNGRRLFDISTIGNLSEMLTWSKESISTWRKNGGQRFTTSWQIDAQCDALGLTRVPNICEIPGDKLPQSIEDAYAFLCDHVPTTRVKLDDTGRGRSEGLVIRTLDRAVIRKMRYEDYLRTLRRRQT